ncbi:isoleucyl-tRNA synthetase-like protein [Sporormia fimetaria CBS 119925]|uniref:isoleucine--tRNA ligase n=1 Tax=Sporormia fimetaria CBS 119925 TaxID=1340428 RepID=A0A6A6VQT6_9PLEO|nr:isoleucyl-tRNA synthetase-like protein [Sporormia fimetaria CBS 119925]
MLTPTRFLRASWSSTLRLPKSNFPARPLPEANAEYLRRCTDELYSWQQKERSNPKTDTFTLHDGPPYANGPLHIGHALNKVTKDIICRFELAQGKRALQAQKNEAAAHTDPISVRKAARQLATETIEQQKKGFKEWAVMGDWDNAYKTMEKGFEIRQLEVFKKMFDRGLIYRQFKPVYWSPSSRTALAEAELEYDENHKSLAAFIRFPVTVSDELRSGALAGITEPLSIVIWTTTPWTLPANKAVAVHNDMEYALVRDAQNGDELVLVAASRVAHYQEMLGHDVSTLPKSLCGSDLAGHLCYENPFQKANEPQPVLHADFVSDASGTGLVHMAPGHGMDDYNVCSAMGIPAFAPVDDAGAFTKEAFPEQPELLEGLPVSDVKRTGSRAILGYLEGQNMLRAKHNYTHKYPIDWRTKQPVIVRATAQWFANVDGIKEKSMRATEGVAFMPETAKHRLQSFIQGRSQWCISRQRAWGVPIPAVYKVTSDELEAVMDSESIQHVIDVIKERGIDAWWTDAQDDPVWKPKHLSGSFVRGRDTMDVWFDSGTSWTLLPKNGDEPVADAYLEGTDQHRGWFQSSLLTYVATQDGATADVKAPYKTLITHGFTLDSKGRKMSKSLGNVVSPSQIMSGELLPPLKRKKQKGARQEEGVKQPQYDSMGSDALRLWAASSDYTRDVTIGQPVLLSVNQALHKYRVTFKWLLGILSLPSCPPNFSSLNTVRDSVNPTDFALLTDKLALHRLAQVSQIVHTHYSSYEFFKGVNAINKYVSNDLSAFYFETLKDRVYTGSKSDCQTLQNVLAIIFYELLHMLAPVCPLLVEEVWDYLPETLKSESVHPGKAVWQPLARDAKAEEFDGYLRCIGDIGGAINAAQERLRIQKVMGSGLECDVFVGLPEGVSDATLCALLGNKELAGLFVVSGFETGTMEELERRSQGLVEAEKWHEKETVKLGENEVTVLVSKPVGDKCPRCWRFVAPEPETLCTRCEDVVKESGV